MHRTCAFDLPSEITGERSRGRTGAPLTTARRPRLNPATTPGNTTCGSGGQAVLAASDLVTLTVLGAVSEGLEGFHEISTAARSIAACDWQPTADLVAAAITRAVADGYLIREEASATASRFILSAAGKDHLCALLDRPSPGCRDSLGRTITALKVCFLGALDPAHGCAVLESLSAGYRCELQVLRKGCRSCPVGRGYARLWIDREVQRMEQEVAWLEGLRADLTVNTPSQQGGS